MTLIEFKNVDKTYDNKTLFSDLCLSIKQGEFITLTGTSGDGKTTLLRMINGLVSPDRGDIIINSQSIKQQNLLSLRRNIGYAIQGSGLFPHMSIADNMLYVPSLFLNWSQDQKTRRLDELLEIVSLEPSLLTRFPDELSGGQQQRVGIARALAAEPKILLMDEPFGALDPSTRTQLQDAIKAIHTKLGITIVFVTHDNEEAKKLATRRLKLSGGKISVEV